MTTQPERMPRIVTGGDPEPHTHLRLEHFPTPGAVVDMQVTTKQDANMVIALMRRWKRTHKRVRR